MSVLCGCRSDGTFHKEGATICAAGTPAKGPTYEEWRRQRDADEAAAKVAAEDAVFIDNAAIQFAAAHAGLMPETAAAKGYEMAFALAAERRKRRGSK